jgi:hypothetical protein
VVDLETAGLLTLMSSWRHLKSLAFQVAFDPLCRHSDWKYSLEHEVS